MPPSPLDAFTEPVPSPLGTFTGELLSYLGACTEQLPSPSGALTELVPSPLDASTKPVSWLPLSTRHALLPSCPTSSSWWPMAPFAKSRLSAGYFS